MMAKPVRALELHYPMIQFLIKQNILTGGHYNRGLYLTGKKLDNWYSICCRNFDRYSVVCRPWITIDGTSSKHLLRMFREMVLMLILDNPGIPEVSGMSSVQTTVELIGS